MFLKIEILCNNNVIDTRMAGDCFPPQSFKTFNLKNVLECCVVSTSFGLQFLNHSVVIIFAEGGKL